MKDHPTRRWLPAEKVAARMGVSRKTIYRWVEQGRFPRGVRIGGNLKWASDAIERWEAEQIKKAGG